MNKRKAKKLAKKLELYGEPIKEKIEIKATHEISLVTKYLPLLDEVYKQNEKEE